MSRDRIKIVPILKRSLEYLIEDPGFIGLYLLPFLVYAGASIHLWLVFGPTIPRQIAQPSELRSLIMENIWWIFINVVVYGIASLVLGLAAYASIILKAAARRGGKSVNFVTALRQGLGFVPKLFVASILLGLIIGTPFSVFIILGIFVSPIAFIGALIYFLPMIYLSIRLLLFAQACVVENLGPIECLKKSWRTTEGSFWRIFLTLLIFMIISMVVGLIPAIGRLIAGLLIGPISIITFTLIYLGLAEG